MSNERTPSELELLQMELRYQTRIVETSQPGSLTHEIAKQRLAEATAALDALKPV